MSDNQNNKIPAPGDIMDDCKIFVGIDPSTGKGLLRTHFIRETYSDAASDSSIKREACGREPYGWQKPNYKLGFEEFDLPTFEQALLIRQTLSPFSRASLKSLWCKPPIDGDSFYGNNCKMILLEDGSEANIDADTVSTKSGVACFVKTFDLDN